MLNYFEARKYVVTKLAPPKHMEVNSKYCFFKIDVIPRNGESQMNLDFDISPSAPALLPKTLRLMYFYKEKREIIKEITRLFMT